MNLRNWNKNHVIGMLLGLITPLLFVPVVLLIISWMQDYYFTQLWFKLMTNVPYQVRIITLSIISNLFWFYFFLNREHYDRAMGVILGSLLFAPYIIYIKFL